MLIRNNIIIKYQGHPNDYVGVNITNNAKGHLMQPILIDTIVSEVGIGAQQATLLIPINYQRVLDHHLYAPAQNTNTFNY